MKFNELAQLVEQELIKEAKKKKAGVSYEKLLRGRISNALASYWKTPEATLAGHVRPKGYGVPGVAGGGSRSDVELVCDVGKIFSLEVKTQIGAEFGQFAVGFNLGDWSWTLGEKWTDDPMAKKVAEIAFANPSWGESVVTFEPWEVWMFQDVLTLAKPEHVFRKLEIPTSGRNPFEEKYLKKLKDLRGKTLLGTSPENIECLTLQGSRITGLASGQSGGFCKKLCAGATWTDAQGKEMTLEQPSITKICTMREDLKLELERFWGLTKSDDDPDAWSGYTPIPWDDIKDKYMEKGDMFVQVGGHGLYALKKEYQWVVAGKTIPLWQDEEVEAKVRFRLKRQSSTLDPLTLKFALGIKNLKPSPVSLGDPKTPKPNTAEFKDFIVRLAEEFKQKCVKKGKPNEHKTKHLTKTPGSYTMLREMIENLMGEE